VEVVSLVLTSGATANDALSASGLLSRHAVALDTLRLSVWGRRCALSRVLHEGDRVECCRPLVVDPKQARRLRSAVQPQKRKRPAGAGR
jgi:putative ubiquitin-RnfH superfamily antitoxin RatB of RatAB toxin-antitoxin module